MRRHRRKEYAGPRPCAALKKVSARDDASENTGFEEKYPIGLIDINLWEWPQGVGLYGLYNYYKLTGDRGTFDFLCGWYDARMAEGLPERNVNTTCPMLTLLCVYEDTQDERYGALCRDWAEWVMHGLIRTGDGAFLALRSPATLTTARCLSTHCS